MKLNKNKTKILSDAASVRGVEEICGVEMCSKVKYLGVTVSLKKVDIVRDAKEQIKRHLKLFKRRVTTQINDIKRMMHTAYVRSLMIYFFTSLKATDIISDRDIESFEIYMKR